MSFTAIVPILLGLAVLLAGRELFWLFVGAVGFVLGFNFVAQFLGDQPLWLAVIIGVLAGIVGAVLAGFLQQAAVAVVGFLAGGYLVLTLAQLIGLEPGLLRWVIVVAGGIVGAVLVIALFDYALVFLSAGTGAALLSQAFTFNQPWPALFFLVLLVVGIGVQASRLTQKRRTLRVRRG